MVLSDLKVKGRAIIQGFQASGYLQDRLMELGIVPGTQVMLKRFAPLGCPMEISVRGYSLSIRKEDAAQILISPLV